eukprot:g1874.t1
MVDDMAMPRLPASLQFKAGVLLKKRQVRGSWPPRRFELDGTKIRYQYPRDNLMRSYRITSRCTVSAELFDGKPGFTLSLIKTDGSTEIMHLRPAATDGTSLGVVERDSWVQAIDRAIQQAPPHPHGHGGTSDQVSGTEADERASILSTAVSAAVTRARDDARVSMRAEIEEELMVELQKQLEEQQRIGMEGSSSNAAGSSDGSNEGKGGDNSQVESLVTRPSWSIDMAFASRVRGIILHYHQAQLAQHTSQLSAIKVAHMHALSQHKRDLTAATMKHAESLREAERMYARHQTAIQNHEAEREAHMAALRETQEKAQAAEQRAAAAELQALSGAMPRGANRYGSARASRDDESGEGREQGNQNVLSEAFGQLLKIAAAAPPRSLPTNELSSQVSQIDVTDAGATETAASNEDTNASTPIFGEVEKEGAGLSSPATAIAASDAASLLGGESGESTEAEAENIILSLRAGMDQCALSHDLDVDHDCDGANENHALVSPSQLLLLAVLSERQLRSPRLALRLFDEIRDAYNSSASKMDTSENSSQLKLKILYAGACYRSALLLQEHAALGGTTERMTAALARHQEAFTAFCDCPPASQVDMIGDEGIEDRADLLAHEALAATASTLVALSRPEAAVDKYQQLVTFENKLSPHISATSRAETRRNLAIVFQGLKRHHDALEHFTAAAKLYRAAVGESEVTASCIFNSAVVLEELGRYTECLQTYEEALAMQRKVLGDHQQTAETLESISLVLEEHLDRPSEALPQCEEALKISWRVVGEHKDTAHKLYNKAVLLEGKLGRPAEAIDSYEEALRLYLKTLGPHKNTAGTHEALAHCLEKKLNKPEQALSHYEQAVEMYDNVLGNHFVTGSTMYNLAMLLKNKLAQPKRAVEYFKRALAKYRVCLGEHKNTADCLEQLAILLEEQLSRPQEALEKHEEALKIYRQCLGDHSLTASTLYNIALTLEELEQPRAALDRYREALRVSRVAQGDHENTANICRNIAILLEEQCGENEAAMTQYAEALRIYVAELGSHTSTASTLYNMATLAKDKLARPKQALEYFGRAATIFEEVYGLEHEYAIDAREEEQALRNAHNQGQGTQQQQQQQQHSQHSQHHLS